MLAYTFKLRFPPLVFKRIVDQNCVLPLRTSGQKRDRTAHQLLDTPNVLNGRGRKLGPGACQGGLALPTLDRFIDRLDPGLGTLAGREVVDFTTIEPIGHTNLDLRPAIQNAELG